MEYQKIANLLDDASSNQPSKFKTKNLVEVMMNQKEHTIECGFTLKRVRDMIRTYSQMHRTDKY